MSSIKEYEKEIKEQKRLIKFLKKEFINQCKNGIWREIYSYDTESCYENEFFRFKSTNKSDSIFILNENYSIELNKIGIGYIRLFFLFYFYIKKSAKKLKKDHEMKTAFIFSNKFFEKNKQLMRESRINNIIN